MKEKNRTFCSSLTILTTKLKFTFKLTHLSSKDLNYNSLSESQLSVFSSLRIDLNLD